MAGETDEPPGLRDRQVDEAGGLCNWIETNQARPRGVHKGPSTHVDPPVGLALFSREPCTAQGLTGVDIDSRRANTMARPLAFITLTSRPLFTTIIHAPTWGHGVGSRLICSWAAAARPSVVKAGLPYRANAREITKSLPDRSRRPGRQQTWPPAGHASGPCALPPTGCCSGLNSRQAVGTGSGAAPPGATTVPTGSYHP